MTLIGGGKVVSFYLTTVNLLFLYLKGKTFCRHQQTNAIKKMYYKLPSLERAGDKTGKQGVFT